MRFLNFAKMKKTWTWEICFPTVEKNHRSKQNSADTCNQVCRVLRSSGKNIKETRWQVSWKDPSFRGENSQLFIYKLRVFLDYSNHKQLFLFKAFASITSALPLEKSWLRPCSDPHSTPWLFIDPLDGPLDPWGSISTTLRITTVSTTLKTTTVTNITQAKIQIVPVGVVAAKVRICKSNIGKPNW